MASDLVGPVNHTEAELLAATDATGAYLSDFQTGNLEGIIGDLIAASENGFDPSEEAAFEAFKAARELATQQLAFSAETITKTQSRIVAMSFCEPRSCLRELSS